MSSEKPNIVLLRVIGELNFEYTGLMVSEEPTRKVMLRIEYLSNLITLFSDYINKNIPQKKLNKMVQLAKLVLQVSEDCYSERSYSDQRAVNHTPASFKPKQEAAPKTIPFSYINTNKYNKLVIKHP